jgi:hypothetical protein
VQLALAGLAIAKFVRKHSQTKDKYEIMLMQFLLHSNHLLYTLSLCVSKQTSYSMAHDGDGGLSPNHKNLIAAIGIGATTVTGSKLIELALMCNTPNLIFYYI